METGVDTRTGDDRARIVLVGGGIAGLATAWWLGRRGVADVLLLERDAQLASRSSALNAAILRTLDPDPAVAAWNEASARFLADPPPGFTEVPLVDRCGLVLAAPEGAAADELAGWIAQRGRETRAEELTPAMLAELAPHYAGAGQRAWLFPDEGRIDVAELCQAFVRGARAAGVRIRAGGPAATVTDLVVEDGAVAGVRLADGNTVRADVVAIAAGAWAGPLGRRAGSRVRMAPTRRHLLVTEADGSVDPRWPVVWRHGDPFYCRPESGGLLVCACDQTDVPDPDALERDEGVLTAIAEKTAANLPAFAEAGAAHWWCGLRTMTPTGRFAIGPDPDVPGLFWVAGLGGHGMTASAEVGRVAAALLCGERVAGAEAFAPTAPIR